MAVPHGEQPPVLTIDTVVVDCADPLTLGRFWQHLLGGELRKDHHEEFFELRGGAVGLDFAQVPEAKQVKNRLHLDLRVDPAQRQQAIDHALALGATTADDLYDGDRWQVMRDPEGNEFCIVWGAA
ncbi:conserved hypothetical protein [Kribbella flavida DSM 17836]|uniref:VOC domain-containing protein n=1 Tax=Kribbella flavida (strain DSM 17836 / JCM 10339 / NBRC 14399) TaxID=479435 RepID=D2PVX7_KRIFD|nr:VOC family protein [Kribbella flavida]ADB29634.1 conserved hypothetical protein [Kribbella flavida DSM 17836]